MTDDFTVFVQQTQAGASRLALALCGGDVHEAADLHQASLERIWSRWRRLHIDNPDAYLRSVIVRTHATRRRKHSVKREQSTAAVPEMETVGGQESYAEAAALTAALVALPLRQRQAVVLRYLEDLPVAEVAEVMSCTEGTVKRAAHDGIRTLRAHLNPPENLAPQTCEVTDV